MKKFYSFLNSKIGLLITGFLLTGILGSYLNYEYQKEVWKRQLRCEIVRRELEQAQNVIEDVLLHLSKRFYSMQKVYWALEGFKIEHARQEWEEYSEIKDQWTLMVNNYRSKIKILLNSSLAYELLDQDDARDYKSKTSVHALFVCAHYKLKDFLNYNNIDSPERKDKEAKALQSLKELGERISKFSDTCYEAYRDKYSLLEKEFKN